MKYPLILFYRDDKYREIDSFIETNADKFACTLQVINKTEKLNKFYKQIYPFLIIYGKTREEYDEELGDFIKDPYISKRILFFSNIIEVHYFFFKRHLFPSIFFQFSPFLSFLTLISILLLQLFDL